jgi:hypothetical protein
MADERPDLDGRWPGDLFIDDESAASAILDGEWFAAPPPEPSSALYAGAAGQTAIYLAQRTPAQAYLGARSLF